MPQPRLYQTRAEQQAAYRARTRRTQEQMLRQKGLPALPAIPSMPGSARWRAAIAMASSLLGQTAAEMQDDHDDRSDLWQESEKADVLIKQIEDLEDIAAQLDVVATPA